MKGYQTTLKKGEPGDGFNYHTLYTRYKPKWTTIRREIRLEIEAINAKMFISDVETNYQRLADRRMQLEEWLEVIPRSGPVVNDELTFVRVREIRIL